MLEKQNENHLETSWFEENLKSKINYLWTMY